MRLKQSAASSVSMLRRCQFTRRAPSVSRHPVNVDRLRQIKPPEQRPLIEFAEADVSVRSFVLVSGGTLHDERVDETADLYIFRVDSGCTHPRFEFSIFLDQFGLRESGRIRRQQSQSLTAIHHCAFHSGSNARCRIRSERVFISLNTEEPAALFSSSFSIATCGMNFLFLIRVGRLAHRGSLSLWCRRAQTGALHN